MRQEVGFFGGRRERVRHFNVGNGKDNAGHFIRTREQCVLAGSAGVQTGEGLVCIAHFQILPCSMKRGDNKEIIYE